MIESITEKNLDEVLPLIREYQEFYKIVGIDDKKNKMFFLSSVNILSKGVYLLIDRKMS